MDKSKFSRDITQHNFEQPLLECVSKLKLMNYREKGLANYRRIVYNRRSKNNEGAQIKWQDDTKLMMHSGKY